MAHYRRGGAKPKAAYLIGIKVARALEMTSNSHGGVSRVDVQAVGIGITSPAKSGHPLETAEVVKLEDERVMGAGGEREGARA